MKCLCCGEELGSAVVCPVCGTRNDPRPLSPAEPKMSQASAEPSDEDWGEKVFESASQGVFMIECPHGAGTGFLISDSGYVVTNTHVVTYQNLPEEKAYALYKGESFPCEIVAIGDDKGGDGDGVDLAVLKLSRVPLGAKPLPISDSESLRNGQRIFVIGNPKNLGISITSGIVSDRLRFIFGHNHIMTDAVINGGNSGGPLLNGRAEAVGVVVSSLREADAMNFAIPSRDLVDFLNRAGIRDYKKDF